MNTTKVTRAEIEDYMISVMGYDTQTIKDYRRQFTAQDLLGIIQEELDFWHSEEETGSALREVESHARRI